MVAGIVGYSAIAVCHDQHCKRLLLSDMLSLEIYIFNFGNHRLLSSVIPVLLEKAYVQLDH